MVGRLLLLIALVVLTGCIDQYSYRPVHPATNQPLYPGGYANHHQFTPEFDRVLYDRPMQYGSSY